MVGVKLVVLAFFVVVAFTAFNSDHFTPFNTHGVDGVVTGASVIFFAYIGFDAVSTGSEEAKNPERDLPLAICGSLAICTVIYIAVAVSAIGVAARRRAGGQRRPRSPRRWRTAPACRGRAA